VGRSKQGTGMAQTVAILGGGYTITITGTFGVVTRSATASLTVQ